MDPLMSPFSLLRKRGIRASLEHEQRKKAKTSMERPTVRAVPEAVRNRPMPQSAPYKTMLECVRNTTRGATSTGRLFF